MSGCIIRDPVDCPLCNSVGYVERGTRDYRGIPAPTGSDDKSERKRYEDALWLIRGLGSASATDARRIAEEALRIPAQPPEGAK